MSRLDKAQRLYDRLSKRYPKEELDAAMRLTPEEMSAIRDRRDRRRVILGSVAGFGVMLAIISTPLFYLEVEAARYILTVGVALFVAMAALSTRPSKENEAVDDAMVALVMKKLKAVKRGRL